MPATRYVYVRPRTAAEQAQCQGLRDFAMVAGSPPPSCASELESSTTPFGSPGKHMPMARKSSAAHTDEALTPSLHVRTGTCSSIAMSANVSWTPDGASSSPMPPADASSPSSFGTPARAAPYSTLAPFPLGVGMPAGAARGHALPSAFTSASPLTSWRLAPPHARVGVNRLVAGAPLATVDSGDAPSFLSHTQEASFMSCQHTEAGPLDCDGSSGATGTVPASGSRSRGARGPASHPLGGTLSLMPDECGSPWHKSTMGCNVVEGTSNQLSTFDSYTCLPLPPPSTKDEKAAAGKRLLPSPPSVVRLAVRSDWSALSPPQQQRQQRQQQQSPQLSEASSPVAMHAKQGSLASSLGPTVTLDPAAAASASAEMAQSVTACISGLGAAAGTASAAAAGHTGAPGGADLVPVMEASSEVLIDDSASLSGPFSEDGQQAARDLLVDSPSPGSYMSMNPLATLPTACTLGDSSVPSSVLTAAGDSATESAAASNVADSLSSLKRSLSEARTAWSPGGGAAQPAPVVSAPPHLGHMKPGSADLSAGSCAMSVNALSTPCAPLHSEEKRSMAPNTPRRRLFAASASSPAHARNNYQRQAPQSEGQVAVNRVALQREARRLYNLPLSLLPHVSAAEPAPLVTSTIDACVLSDPVYPPLSAPSSAPSPSLRIGRHDAGLLQRCQAGAGEGGLHTMTIDRCMRELTPPPRHGAVMRSAMDTPYLSDYEGHSSGYGSALVPPMLPLASASQRPPRVPAPLTGRLSPPLALHAPSSSTKCSGRDAGAASPVTVFLAPPLSSQANLPYPARAHLFHTMPHAPVLPQRPSSRNNGFAAAAGDSEGGGCQAGQLSMLDSLLNSGYDNGALERCASEQVPEPHLPFHETLGGGEERRHPRLGGQELYLSLLGSLRESIDRRMRAASGAPPVRRDSSFGLDSLPSLGGMAARASQLVSMEGALARLQMTVEGGAFGVTDVLPVHTFLPKVRTKGRRRRRIRPKSRLPRHAVSPEYVAPPPRACYVSTGGAGAVASSTATPSAPELLLTLEGQPSRPLSTPLTFPRPPSSDEQRPQDGLHRRVRAPSGLHPSHPAARGRAGQQQYMLRGTHPPRCDHRTYAVHASGHTSKQRAKGAALPLRDAPQRGESWFGRTLFCCGAASVNLYEENEVEQRRAVGSAHRGPVNAMNVSHAARR